jgi:hypothetical protein
VDYYEQGRPNSRWISSTAGEFPEYLSDYQPLKKDCAMELLIEI